MGVDGLLEQSAERSPEKVALVCGGDRRSYRQLDEQANRFIVTIIQRDDTTQASAFYVAVSNSSDPTAGFTERQKINVKQTTRNGTAVWADFSRTLTALLAIDVEVTA